MPIFYITFCKLIVKACMAIINHFHRYNLHAKRERASHRRKKKPVNLSFIMKVWPETCAWLCLPWRWRWRGPEERCIEADAVEAGVVPNTQTVTVAVNSAAPVVLLCLWTRTSWIRLIETGIGGSERAASRTVRGPALNVITQGYSAKHRHGKVMSIFIGTQTIVDVITVCGGFAVRSLHFHTSSFEWIGVSADVRWEQLRWFFKKPYWWWSECRRSEGPVHAAGGTLKWLQSYTVNRIIRICKKRDARCVLSPLWMVNAHSRLYWESACGTVADAAAEARSASGRREGEGWRGRDGGGVILF